MTVQLTTGTDDEKVSKANETQILQFLIDSIDALLENFGIPLEKLTAQLADGVYSSGSNAWAAAQVSLGEQRVLRLAREKAEQLLLRLTMGSTLCHHRQFSARIAARILRQLRS